MEVDFNLKKKSDIEKLSDIDNAKQNRSITTTIYRNLKLNLDIFQLIVLCFAFLGAGYTISYAINNDNFELSRLIDCLTALGTGIAIFVWRLYTPQGYISTQLSNQGNNIDKEGHTIVTK